jgi:ribosome-associated protein
MPDNDRIIQRVMRELTFDFIRSTGPGGQNVNKVATAVQLRFNVISSPVLSDTTKTRLIHLDGKKMTNLGLLVIEAHRFRTQDKNREDAIDRFSVLISKSLEKPKIRRKTRPSTASKEKRLVSKKKRSEVKRTRQNRSLD